MAYLKIIYENKAVHGFTWEGKAKILAPIFNALLALMYNIPLIAKKEDK